MSVTFEDFIIQCCKAPEGQLRKWLKKVLIRNGFVIQEDNYQSERVKKDPSLAGVHNMLAIRGDNPRVCLVAHTDVCRDHGRSVKAYDEAYYMCYGKHMSDKEKEVELEKGQNSAYAKKVQPVIKVAEIDGEKRRIIQDKDCMLQVGGDDRLGVAIATWVALNSGYSMGLLFTTDEEIGLVSAKECKFDDLMKFDLLCQIDRGNHSNELVIKIGSTALCSYDAASRLLEVAYDLNFPRKVVNGMGTDVVAMKNNKVIKDCVNLTCGYHNSVSDGPDEYIDIQEAKDTLKYMAAIIKDYDLNK